MKRLYLTIEVNPKKLDGTINFFCNKKYKTYS